MVVGRAPGCLLRLDNPRVSAEHASIFWTGERWELRDLGSRNGTFVDGRRTAPGERIALREGTRLSFASPDDCWALVNDLPPVASATRCDVPVGEREMRIAQDGLLALPSADDPQISIFENEGGRWFVEGGGPARPGVDGERLDCTDSGWILSIPPPSPGGVVATTRRDMGLPKMIGVLTLLFHVSLDNEYVQLALVQGSETINLNARAHHELILTLARARIAARGEVDKPESERGWLYVDDVAAMLRVESERVNMFIYRARQQLAEAGVLNAGSLFERRPTTRQLRLATDHIEIRPI
ncbi:uncharacterized protein CMC5_080240 [Chondromyces crocatus]|uniref:FHA domain-containing protein n=2 Tax=Chondromyces crocatus TaxID=52 RepID=A0A0K1ET15_CHOCO|nr:uncharacterized protein CMC5_080240 [Chondromyces crocatus]